MTRKHRLTPARVAMSVMFCNIRGFTGFAEKMEPRDVVDHLNRYFDRMTDVVFQHKGALDKPTGEALRCFWGHPPETEDHAFRSTLCALEMIRIVEELRPTFILPGGARFEIGIGINTAPVIVGNLGSKTRVNYTVIGEGVSLGSRLESLNKAYGTRVLISESTFGACKDLIRCRELDTIRIKGRAATIYEPLGLRQFEDDKRSGEQRTVMTTPLLQTIRSLIGDGRLEERRLGSERLVIRPEQEELATIYEHAMAHYRKGDLESAEKTFNRALSLCPTDGPSRLMKGRISRYLQENATESPQTTPIFKFEAS